jgi:hypothetical protein
MMDQPPKFHAQNRAFMIKAKTITHNSCILSTLKQYMALFKDFAAQSSRYTLQKRSELMKNSESSRKHIYSI